MHPSLLLCFCLGDQGSRSIPFVFCFVTGFRLHLSVQAYRATHLQDDRDLVPEFVQNGGLDCMVRLGRLADQNHQNYILRGVSLCPFRFCFPDSPKRLSLSRFYPNFELRGYFRSTFC